MVIMLHDCIMYISIHAILCMFCLLQVKVFDHHLDTYLLHVASLFWFVVMYLELFL